MSAIPKNNNTAAMKPKFWQMPPPDQTALARLPEKIRLLDQRLGQIAQRFPQAVFASSLAAEDMIVTHRIAAADLPIAVITLDTGCLNAETRALIAQVRRRYPHIRFTVFHPQPEEAARFVAEYGAGAMYESIELRKQCCHIRKVEPLNRPAPVTSTVPRPGGAIGEGQQRLLMIVQMIIRSEPG